MEAVDNHWKMLRRAMVDIQLRARGIHDPHVLRAMETIPRHEFVPSGERHRSYDDSALAIGFGQTISQPYIVGYMSQLLEVTSEHKVLEVGTGSGYQTLILATLAREVFSIDIHPPLTERARARLESMGATNVRFDVRNGHDGWPEFAPYDRIMVTAGAAFIPQPLVDQLAVNGRMTIPARVGGNEQVLKLVVKPDAFVIDIRDTIPVRFVPLVQKPEEL
jgi:protein-L-isoaspartate(D-aspartate) O-methyltransferase